MIGRIKGIVVNRAAWVRRIMKRGLGAVCSVRQRAAVICILTLCILVGGFLTGCSQSGQENTEKVKISVLAKNSWYSDVDYADAEIIKCMEEASEYDIEWKLKQPDSYYDIVRALLLKGKSPADIVQMPDLDENMEYINTGIFARLDEYMEYMPNFQAYLNANPDVKASLTTDEGHIYYVPQTVLTSNYVPCVMYNQEWLESVGKSAPETLDELVELLRIYRDSDMNGNGITDDEVPMSVTAAFLPYMFGPAFGLDLATGFYTDENGQVKYAYYESENYRAYLEFLNGLYDEGLLEPDFDILGRDTVKERCKNNETGIIFDYSWHMSMMYSAQYEEYDGSKPVFAGAKPLSGEYKGYYVGRNAVSGLFGVTIGENTVEAVKLLDYMISETNKTLYCFGIEGKSYVVNSDGSKSFTKEALSDDFVQRMGINPVCLPSRQSVEATDALVPEWHSKIDRELEQYVRKPFPFIYTSESDIQQEIPIEYIAKYAAQQSIDFIKGTVSLEYFDDYIDILKNMGIEHIIEANQKKYNRYERWLGRK